VKELETLDSIAEETLKLWGSGIREERLEREWTVSHLAGLVGVNRSNVVRWEAGATEPSIEHRIILSRELEIAPEDLFIYP